MIASDRPVAAIAGGSRGTGLRIAAALAASGWRVVLLRSPAGSSDAERALIELRRADPGAAAVALDIADEERVDRVLGRIEDEHGPVRLLVHGAGFPLHSGLADLDLADLDRLHRTLVRGAFVLCRWAARTISPGAAVILLSSTLVEHAATGASALIAGSSAVEAVARVAAVELAGRGIGVHVVRVPPGDERLHSGPEHGPDDAESVARAVLTIGNSVRARHRAADADGIVAGCGTIRTNPVCSARLAPSSIDHVIDEDTAAATRSDAGAVLGECPIVLGGPFGAESQEASADRLDAFVEQGGHAVETALSYQAGRGIAAVGAWLAEHPETIETVVKVGHGPQGQDLPLTAQVIGREVETATATLGVDGVGVLLLHSDDAARPVGEIADVLLDVVESGRARAVGASNWSAPRLDELVRRLLSAGHRPLASYHRSLAKPGTERFRGTTLPGDDDIFAVVDRHELPLLSWSANAGGYFARTGAEPESGPFDSPAARAARERCAALASDLGTDAAAVALAWTLARARTWASVGSGSAARIGEAFAATELRLTAEQIRRLADGEPVDHATHGRTTDPR